jgi:hypothetical protein
MEDYVIGTVEISMVTGFIGMATGIYFLIFSNCERKKLTDESDRIIDTVCSVVKGEVRSLQIINDENPYDLFTRIYPTLKDMENSRITEFINILMNYNSSWIYDNEDSDVEDETSDSTEW